jgi:hypothetical protein
MSSITITLNADGTFTGPKGEMLLREVISEARSRREKNSADRKAVRDSVRKRKAQERLARAEKRAAKAAAELKKAQKLAA